MTPEQAAALREPFAAELVGKLPRVWCGACRDARGKVCSDHSKTKCADCGNNITTAHLHLDYVGHADVTDRLLEVDPAWTWEPLAVDGSGLPVLDRTGGLWIRLTVCGVSRLGYGHADGKSGGDAIKECIGDALRNASMRFGVGLDLWRKEKPSVDDGGTRPAARKATSARKATANDAHAHHLADDGPMTDRQRGAIMGLLERVGKPYDANKPEVLQRFGTWIGREITSVKDMTSADADVVMGHLRDLTREPRPGADEVPS